MRDIVNAMTTSLRILGIGCALVGCGKGTNLMLGGGGDPMKYDTGVDIDYLPEDTGSSNDTADAGDDTGSGGTDDTGSSTVDTGSGDTGLVIEGTGYSRGDTAYDLLTTDHTAGAFSLHALYGSPVVLLVGDLYDDRATDTMTAMASLSGEHTDKQFVALIGQDASTTHCDADCAAEVATTYGIPTVIYDASPALPLYTEWAQGNAPRLYVIDAEMKITWVNFGTTSEGQLDDKLDDLD